MTDDKDSGASTGSQEVTEGELFTMARYVGIRADLMARLVGVLDLLGAKIVRRAKP